MRRYEYILKEPCYCYIDGNMVKASKVAFEEEPKYYIANDTVYILFQDSNNVDTIGIPIYLPITMSVGDFKDSLIAYEK